MIDRTVARDKIAQFQNPDEIADFFRSASVVGNMEQADSCVMARWMQNTTGEMIFVSQTGMWSQGDDFGEDSILHTDAMCQFVINFDDYDYPDLVADWRTSS